ncbi:MAG: hypothetical protein QHH06_05900 [Clostridiales bacterium]|nr:hypothetical protein [Eubacteriales bacterium]MDH7565997.1 hypothetical protein [Clostridiales bacterium]
MEKRKYRSRVIVKRYGGKTSRENMLYDIVRLFAESGVKLRV